MFLTKSGKKASLFICDQLMDFVEMSNKGARTFRSSDFNNLDLLWWKKMFRINSSYNMHIHPDLMHGEIYKYMAQLL
jgi:hypothetical protein